MTAPATGDSTTAGPFPADVPVVLAGLHGHGRHHLRNLERLAAEGVPVRLAATCDPRGPDPEVRRCWGDVPHGTDLGELIDRVGARVAVLCTPIHTHADLALVAARHGCDVLLEKPPTATLASFAAVAAGFEELGRVCQVGFQSLGSPALPWVQQLVRSGAVGAVRGVGARGAWRRDSAYWARATWAGRRRLGDVPVVDGVLTNPLAHAVAAALRVDGTPGERPPHDVEVELYRANPIEADDTSCLRLRTASGTLVVVAATLAAVESSDPSVVVTGEAGEIVWFYTRGEVQHRPAGAGPEAVRIRRFGSDDLLTDLVRRLADPGRPLLVPLAATTSFMHVLEAVRTAPDPVPIPAHLVREDVRDGVAGRSVPGVESLVDAAAHRFALFSELGAAWAAGGAAASGPVLEPVADLRVGGDVVARLVVPRGLDATLSPRPFLHEVRTRGGAVVTAWRPADHPWHLGAGVAVPDVGGVNFWGGRSYRRGRGYVWLDDHGRVELRRLVPGDGSGPVAELDWIAPDGRTRLRERRRTGARPVDPDDGARGWVLRLESELVNATPHPLELGSPATHGRAGGGYGGFFWRLPPFDAVTVRTEDGEGEAAVHGRPADWLLLTGVLRSGPAVTLIFRGADAVTRRDPWFVRLEGYPGVGSALAAERPVPLAPGELLHRAVDVVLVDGVLAAGDLPAALAAASGPPSRASR